MHHKDPTEIKTISDRAGPGASVVHPRGELHEYANGPPAPLLFRVAATGTKMSRAHQRMPSNPDWTPAAPGHRVFRPNPGR